MPSTLEKFTRWFIIPLNTLKMIPDGDGAFIALSIGCLLCERYYRIATNTQEIQSGTQFQNAAAADLNVNQEFFRNFWNVYRHGVQHQATPKTFSASDGPTYKWSISADFKAIPTRCIRDGVTIICLDPWKFADSMVAKFLADPAKLEGAIAYEFGEISTAEAPFVCEEVH
jgi:hypothetical protein